MIIILIALLTIAIVIGISYVSMHYVVTSKKPEDQKIIQMKSVIQVFEQCILEAGDNAISQKIRDVVDSLKYSDVNTTAEASSKDIEIYNEAMELLEALKGKKLVEANNYIEHLEKSVKERNIINKYSK